MSTPTAPASHPGLLAAHELLPPVLRRSIGALSGELGRICGYQLGIVDQHGNSTGRVGGKLLRPAMTLLCSAAAGGAPAEVVPAAAAIELLHNSSLIHDDIMDGDRERRHQPTVWAVFGVSSAIVAGDALIALAFEVLANHQHPATVCAIADLSSTLRRMTCGQNSDLHFEREPVVELDECLAMLTGKTGALFGCACRMGAVYAPAGPGWADRFELFGMHAGVAFQLVDDLLGIWGDPAVTGKPAGSDLRARKKSAPVVAALEAGTTGSAQLSKAYGRGDGLSDDEIGQLADLIAEAGGRTWTEAEAERRMSAAWEALADLDLDPVARDGLVELTVGLLTRPA